VPQSRRARMAEMLPNGEDMPCAGASLAPEPVAWDSPEPVEPEESDGFPGDPEPNGGCVPPVPPDFEQAQLDMIAILLGEDTCPVDGYPPPHTGTETPPQGGSSPTHKNSQKTPGVPAHGSVNNNSTDVRVPGWVNIFLGEIMKGTTVGRACQRARVSYAAPYVRQRRDERFRRAWDVAASFSTKALEYEAQRRAFHGVNKPVFYKGVKVGSIKEYSDSLLMFLLKKRDPTYRDRSDVNINNTSNVVNVFDDIRQIERTIELTSAKQLPASGVPQDSGKEPLDGTQTGRAQGSSKAN
jgi:hypothetical protein